MKTFEVKADAPCAKNVIIQAVTEQYASAEFKRQNPLYLGAVIVKDVTVQSLIDEYKGKLKDIEIKVAEIDARLYKEVSMNFRFWSDKDMQPIWDLNRPVQYYKEFITKLEGML